MRAIEITQPGGPDVLKPAARPTPAPRENEILVKVAAAGVNRPDVLQRMGHYPVPPGVSDIPGLEVAGEVVDGSSKLFRKGDNVCALVAGGGYAEYCVVPEAQALPIPRGLTPVEAASLPETFAFFSDKVGRGNLHVLKEDGVGVMVHHDVQRLNLQISFYVAHVDDENGYALRFVLHFLVGRRARQ